ncbi:hypothetical protein B9Z55_025117 [Caenorhabditis nigoni]|uniref:EF-hand domain-containing protein n=1 Tax=Caenorhabditis nigoni TaxID=1611254 RepID=A0A2G5SXJ5_9PELO|nr:hypothetical protein B9Z55_025117 [Caenorhabditis nigoni]
MFDTDGSGAIGNEELKQAMISIGLHANKAEIDNVIKEVSSPVTKDIVTFIVGFPWSPSPFFDFFSHISIFRSYPPQSSPRIYFIQHSALCARSC